ncbi:MAG: VCBS repeat-containing protein [Anaerolineales bacterium]|nr:VCBS repeat-containing protein [Anaerolineales bacterium]
MEKDGINDLEWADFDADGDLDLAAVSPYNPIRLYQNNKGILTTSASWSSDDDVFCAKSIGWGDVDGDGDLDLAAACSGGHPDALYRNESGTLSSRASWLSASSDWTSQLSWIDFDGDGYLDLSTVTNGQLRILSKRLQRKSSPGGSLLLTNALGVAELYSTSKVWNAPIVPITYVLFDNNSSPIRSTAGYFSLNGGGQWLTAVAASDTITANLASAPYPSITATNTHLYNWDVGSSGFMGASDNVVFRLVVIPSVTARPSSVPGPFQYGSFATSSYPFRVRGMQARTVDAQRQPVRGATVFRLPADSSIGGSPITSLTGAAFQTDMQGYLQGRGTLMQGDRLFAVAPITATAKYTLYQTSATPMVDGLDAYTVTQAGVQTLTVSAGEPIATVEPQCVNRMGRLQRHGLPHVAGAGPGEDVGGAVRLERWAGGAGQCDGLPGKRALGRCGHPYLASNQVRPSANRGGIVSGTVTLVDPGLSTPITATQGEIRIGAVWNRYGDPQPIGDDWPRVLAHEIGHYALFLEATHCNSTRRPACSCH